MCGWQCGDPPTTFACPLPIMPESDRIEPTLLHEPPPADGPVAPAPEGAEGAGTQGDSGGFSGVPLTARHWQLAFATPHQAEQVARNPSLPTFVGLIMLILTFFIVLTSISINDRKKSDAAMASLQDAFSGSAVLVPSDTGAEAERAARDFMDGLTRSIQSLVPLMGGETGGTALDQVLWLPASLAFADDGTALLPEFEPVLKELLAATAKIPPRFDHLVELRLCEAAAGDRLRQRAASLVDALARLQAPLANFVVGSQACAADRMAFAVSLAPRAPGAAP